MTLYYVCRCHFFVWISVGFKLIVLQEVLSLVQLWRHSNRPLHWKLGGKMWLQSELWRICVLSNHIQTTFGLTKIIIWIFSPSEKLFIIGLPFQDILNHPIRMSESKVMAETLGQHQNCHLHANGRCMWDNFEELT